VEKSALHLLTGVGLLQSARRLHRTSRTIRKSDGPWVPDRIMVGTWQPVVLVRFRMDWLRR